MFHPKELSHFISFVYPQLASDDDDEQVAQRRRNHENLNLNRPVLRRADVHDFTPVFDQKYLVNPHVGLKTTGESPHQLLWGQQATNLENSQSKMADSISFEATTPTTTTCKTTSTTTAGAVRIAPSRQSSRGIASKVSPTNAFQPTTKSNSASSIWKINKNHLSDLANGLARPKCQCACSISSMLILA